MLKFHNTFKLYEIVNVSKIRKRDLVNVIEAKMLAKFFKRFRRDFWEEGRFEILAPILGSHVKRNEKQINTKF